MNSYLKKATEYLEQFQLSLICTLLLHSFRDTHSVQMTGFSMSAETPKYRISMKSPHFKWKGPRRLQTWATMWKFHKAKRNSRKSRCITFPNMKTHAKRWLDLENKFFHRSFMSTNMFNTCHEHQRKHPCGSSGTYGFNKASGQMGKSVIHWSPHSLLIHWNRQMRIAQVIFLL